VEGEPAMITLSFIEPNGQGNLNRFSLFNLLR